MKDSDIKELEQLHAEMAEKDAEIQSLTDELAYMMCENRALKGQLSLVKQDCQYSDSLQISL